MFIVGTTPTILIYYMKTYLSSTYLKDFKSGTGTFVEKLYGGGDVQLYQWYWENQYGIVPWYHYFTGGTGTKKIILVSRFCRKCGIFGHPDRPDELGTYVKRIALAARMTKYLEHPHPMRYFEILASYGTKMSKKLHHRLGLF